MSLGFSCFGVIIHLISRCLSPFRLAGELFLCSGLFFFCLLVILLSVGSGCRWGCLVVDGVDLVDDLGLVDGRSPDWGDN